MVLFNFFKKLIWKLITPIFPQLRDLAIKTKVIKHEGRQPYHLGWLKEGVNLADFKKNLAREGFAENIFALIDEGQVLSLRLLESFAFQYHLRVFKGGEVRGHYETTPEAYPIKHWKDIGMEPRQHEFMEFLKGWLE